MSSDPIRLGSALIIEKVTKGHRIIYPLEDAANWRKGYDVVRNKVEATRYTPLLPAPSIAALI